MEAAADHNAEVVIGVGSVGISGSGAKGVRISPTREVVGQMALRVGVKRVRKRHSEGFGSSVFEEGGERMLNLTRLAGIAIKDSQNRRSFVEETDEGSSRSRSMGGRGGPKGGAIKGQQRARPRTDEGTNIREGTGKLREEGGKKKGGADVGRDERTVSNGRP